MPPPAPAKGLPKWAWPAAIAGGLVIGFVFLKKGDAGAQPAEVVGTLGDGSAFSSPPPQQAQGSSDSGMESVLGALGLLGDQIGALQGDMRAYYGSGGTSQSGGGTESGGGVVEQAQATAQAPAPSGLSTEFGPAVNGVTPLPSWSPSESGFQVSGGVGGPGGGGGNSFGRISGAAGAGSGVGQTAGGVDWGGQTFYTKASLSSWLSARGSNYQTWAKNHPGAAARLK